MWILCFDDAGMLETAYGESDEEEAGDNNNGKEAGPEVLRVVADVGVVLTELSEVMAVSTALLLVTPVVEDDVDGAVGCGWSIRSC